MSVEAVNEAFKKGTFARTMENALAELKPEAAYFVTEDGKRTGYFVVDVKEPSQMPAIAEPWFLAFKASVDFYPAMIPADLAKAGPAIEQAVKKYG